MARILGGGAFGEMRGKLGSMVFARNKGGAYARQYAKPVDPRTVAQLTARSKFGGASSIYHSLSDMDKVAWNNFASSVFNAKTGKVGVASGFNAFVSLATVVSNTKLFSTFSYEAAAPLTGTNIPFYTNQFPPTFSLQSNIKITSMGPGSVNFNLDSIDPLVQTIVGDTVTFAGTVNFHSFGEIGGGTTSSVLQDAMGNTFGFKIFMSNSIQQNAMFVQNPYLIELGSSPAQSFSPSADFRSDFKLNFEAELNSGDYQSLPIPGQFVQLTVFQVSSRGMLLKTGAKIVKLT